jgi:hypothetical protein
MIPIQKEKENLSKVNIFLIKTSQQAWHWWLMPVFLTTWETEFEAS